MGKGFGAGLIWGSVVFVAGFLGLALLAPPDEDMPLTEQPSAPEVPAPQPETASPAPEPSADVPEPDVESAEAPAAAPAPTAPAERAPAASDDPPPTPSLAQTPTPPAPAPADDPGPGDVTPETETETPAPQRPAARDPGAPEGGIGAGDAPPAQRPAPTVAEPPGAPRPEVDAPEVTAEPDAPASGTAARPSPPTSSDETPPPSMPPPATTPAPDEAPAPEVAATDAAPGDTPHEDAAPEGAPESAPEEAPQDAEIAVRVPEAPAVRTDRLPRIGDALPDDAAADDAAIEETDPEEGAEPNGTAEADASLPAVLRHAAEVSVSGDRPRLAVILIDDGVDTDTRADLTALPFPVTVALDPLAEGATDAATAYRTAGMEVLMLATEVPARATASDLDVLFEGYLDALPEAVGLIDTPEGGFQNNRALAQLMVPVLERDGHALVSYARGLNAAAQLAEAAGLARGQVFRVLDADDESVFTIRRYLDRAVFEAGREGSVIVLGHAARPDTLAGLLSWRMEGRADEVELVPVTAALGGM